MLECNDHTLLAPDENSPVIVESSVSVEAKPLSKKERKMQKRAEWKSELKHAKRQKKALHPFRWSGSENVTVLEACGVSRVAPYPAEFLSNCKHRWIGRRVVEVLADEFNAYSLQYFERCVEQGKLLINGERFSLDYCFKAQDSLVHHAHRHEPPVRVLRSENIIYQCKDRLVINKPSSIPIHPCGRYQYNSIVHILARKFGIDYAHPVHRLDRLTSGVLVLALNPETARSITNSIESREMAKFYLARVLGEFPTSSAHHDSLSVDVPSSIAEVGEDFQGSQWIVSDAPIACLSKKFSVFGVSTEDGKPCSTAFRRVNYNGRTSVVLCYPITGRTHQIRVHLQHLGFPIANDPCYGGKLCVGNTLLESDSADEEQNRLIEEFNNDVLRTKMPLCPECNQCDQHYVPADPATQGGLFCSEIWLHALSYSCEQWSFSVPVPMWARPTFDDCSYLQDIAHSALSAL